MERLLERLDYIQEQILTLYEKDSVDLEDHIRLWNLLRRENAIWYVLRQEGHARVGGRAVPAMTVSEANAKFAIEMQIKLESLKASPYAAEGWSLQETTKERYLAEPSRTFKKLGQPVTLMFDNDPENLTEVVLWKWVYYITPTDEWYKARGGIDDTGIYYIDHESVKMYYVRFDMEAENFSETGTVTYRLGSALVNVPEPVTVTDSSSTRERTPKVLRPQGSRRRRNEETGEPVTPAPKRRRGAYGRRSSPKAQRRTAASPVSRGNGGSSDFTSGESDEGHRVRHRALRKKTAGVAPAEGHYLVGAKGPVNSLRCLRYKWKNKYSGDIMYLGTTFTWTESDGTERCGSGRFFCAFSNETKREKFLKSVKIPKNIGLFRAHAEKL